MHNGKLFIQKFFLFFLFLHLKFKDFLHDSKLKFGMALYNEFSDYSHYKGQTSKFDFYLFHSIFPKIFQFCI